MPIPATITVFGVTVKTTYVAGAAAVAVGYYLFATPSGKELVSRYSGGGGYPRNDIGAAALPAAGY